MSTYTHITRIAAAALMIMAAAAAAQAQGSNSASVTVSATVVQALTITGKTALDFGTVLPGSGEGKVVVTAQSERKASGKVVMQDGGFAAARFTINGTAGRSYVVNTPDTLVFHVEGGKADLQVTDFTTYSKNSRSSDKRGLLDSNGRDELTVGGTLNVPANVVPGRYKGDVPITVAYQ